MAVLVLAEKPSVAREIAKVIGAGTKKDGYLEGAGFIVSWCVGHLVEPAAADLYDEAYSKWRREDLPILPEKWKYVVTPSTKKQFDVVKKLMEREDVEELVEATDAGREGELIFRLVYHKAGCKKPFKRLWISSMEDKVIRQGFENLHPGAEYDLLYEAALCRMKADWIVGINGTRLFTTLYHAGTLNVGRVMTPTLAFVTEREKAITGFQKEKFYTVELNCGDFTAASGRFTGKTDAEKLRISCVGKPVTVESVARQEKTEKPPKLYDLTTLQREANRAYGYTAQQTLDCMQLLYEKKLLTYPRTDSRFLTEDMADGLPGLCEKVAVIFPKLAGSYPDVDAGRVVDSSKVSDHHAVIPTGEMTAEKYAELPTSERNIYTMVSARLLCAVRPDDHVYADTAVKLLCGDTEFSAKGRTEFSEGWKAVEKALGVKTDKGEKGSRGTGKSAGKQGADRAKNGGRALSPLPEMSEGQAFTAQEALVREGTTSPPERYTEDTLLSAMEHAGNEDLAEDIERKGIGTPATRAGVIEKLVKAGFIERKEKRLIPTKRGMELIEVMPDTVTSARLTAEWEKALKEVEKGKRTPEDFMAGIREMVSALVKSYEGMTAADNPAFAKPAPAKENMGKCPRCGKDVFEGNKSFYCSGYKDDPPCSFSLWKDNPYFKSKRKELTKGIVKTLLKKGCVKLEGLYSEKKDITYDATIVMEDTGTGLPKFRLEFEKGKEAKKG